MWLKLAGGIVIVLVSTYVGFQMAARCNGRPQHIRQIGCCLASLKSYIHYASLPLQEAMKQCTQGIHGPVAEFFHRIANILEEHSQQSPQEAIQTALEEFTGKLLLKQPELELLELLGANLGIMNRQEQVNYLTMIIEQFEKLEIEAVRFRDLNTKMYRYLGLCGGLALVILLV